MSVCVCLYIMQLPWYYLTIYTIWAYTMVCGSIAWQSKARKTPTH